MKAKMKCSQCGAEMETMKFTWGQSGKWVALSSLVSFGFMFYLFFLGPMSHIFVGGDDPGDVMEATVDRFDWDDDSLIVTGEVTNNSDDSYSFLRLLIEVHDEKGKLISQSTEYSLRYPEQGCSDRQIKGTISGSCKDP